MSLGYYLAILLLGHYWIIIKASNPLYHRITILSNFITFLSTQIVKLCNLFIPQSNLLLMKEKDFFNVF